MGFNLAFKGLKTYIGLHLKYTLFWSDCNETWIFLDRFSKKCPQISNFIKISPVGDEVFHADGRTDMTKLITAFRNYVNASKKNNSNS